MKYIILFGLCLVLVAGALAANDPGHDTLYIEQTGDSELTGSLNVTQILKVNNRTDVDSLTLYGDGTNPSTGNYISGATGTDLIRIGTAGNLYLKDDGGDQVIIGVSGTPTLLNVFGDVNSSSYVNASTDVCIIGGTCLSSIGGSGNVTSIIAGNGISVSGAVGDVTVSANAVTCGAGNFSTWTGSAWTCGTPGSGTDDQTLQEVTTSGTTTTDAITIDSDGNGATTIGGNFTVNNTNLHVDTSTNRVGIGTASPGAKLHVLSTTEQLRLGYNATSYTTFTTGASGQMNVAPSNTKFNLYDGSQNFDLSIYDAGTEAITLNANGISFFNGGNVGIGTTSPAYGLHVFGTGTQRIKVESSNSQAGIEFEGQNNNSFVIYQPGGTSNDLYFWDGSIVTVAMKDGGDVGIGTTGPTSKMHILGPTINTNADATYGLAISDNADTTQKIIFGYSKALGAGIIAATQTAVDWKNLVLNPHGGNVGIGIETPGEKLEVAGNINATGDICITAGNCLSTAGSSGWTDQSPNVSLTDANDNVSVGMLFVDNTNNRTQIGQTDALKIMIGDAISGGLIHKADNTSFLALASGTATGDGANIVLSATNRTAYAGNMEFRVDTVKKLHYVDATSDWSFEGLNVKNIENLTINSNVGIGTTNPEVGLDVYGGFQSNGSFKVTANGGSHIQRNYSADNSTSRSILALKRLYEGGPGANGIGAHLDFWTETTTEGTIDAIAQIKAINYNATDNGADSELQFRVYKDGSNIQALTINSTGNVGIGTSTPGEKLEVAGNINATGDICITGGNCLSTVGGGSSGPYGWTNTSTVVSLSDATNNISAGQLYVDNTNNRVGIGTTTPSAILNIQSNSADDVPGLTVNGGGDATNEYVAYFLGRASTFPSTVLRLASNRASTSNYNFIEAIQDEDGTPNTAFIVRGDGNVGIGTTNPQHPLDVRNDGTANDGAIQASNGTSDIVLYPHVSTGGFTAISQAGDQAIITTKGVVDTGALVLAQWNTNGAGIRISANEDIQFNNDNDIYIDGVGDKVGIGTATPTEKLTIGPYSGIGNNNNILINGTGFGGAGIGLERNSKTTWEALIRFYTGSIIKWKIGLDSDATDNLHIIGPTGTAMTILDSNGNVGIGTTTPGALLHVNSSGGENDGILIGNVGLFPFSTSGANTGNPTFQNRYAENSSTNLRIMPYGDGNANFEFFNNDYYDVGNAWENFRILATDTAFTLDTASGSGGLGRPMILMTKGNSNQIYLDNTTSNVGIGTTTPGANLHVGTGTPEVATGAGDIYATDTIEADGNLYIAGNAGIGTETITQMLTVNGGFELAGTIYANAINNRGSNDLAFVTTSGGNFTFSNGNVGIGTTSPDKKLQVVGDIMIGETDTTGGLLYLYGTTAGAYSTIKTTNGNLHIDAGYGGTGNTLYLNYYSGTGGTVFGNGASGGSGASVSSTGIVTATTIDTGSGAKELGDAAVANGDTNSIPTGDQVYDFVIGQGYTTNTGDITGITTAVSTSGLNGGCTSGTCTLTFDATDVDGSGLTGSGATLSVTTNGITDTHLAYNTGQHLTTTSAVTFGTINTGNGPTEVYDMNQNVLTTSNVEHNIMYISGTNLMIYESSTNTLGFRTGSSGAFKYAKFTSAGNWDVLNGGYMDSGSCVAGTCASDRRLKKNITLLNGSLNILTQLNPVRFNWRTEEHPELNNETEIGLIAQEVQKILPQLVKEKNGYLAVKYGMELNMITIQAVKELKEEKDAEITQLTQEKNKEISDLKQDIAELKFAVEKLQNPELSTHRIDEGALYKLPIKI